ncbi:MAG: sensor histidine kinase, partial [Candidatus Omnitrophota bacterium]|nr:sensor histidine kinase [Candidatus Omnitrophota bacterium]
DKGEIGIVSPDFPNALATDRYGGLAGASYRPRSFYYGDDDWWQKAFAESKGKIFLEDAVFDTSAKAQDQSRASSAPSMRSQGIGEPTGRWVFPMVAVIEDGKDAAIGVYRAFVDISGFSKPLEGVTFGKNVRAALIDGRGYLVFYPGVKPFSNKFCEYDELQRLLNNKKGWSVIDTVYMAAGKTAVAFSPVRHPLISIGGAGLYVVVSENSRELCGPLNILAARMAQFSVILALAVLVFAGLAFKRTFTGPIKGLIEGMKYIGDGILDHRVNIKTGDEMEELGAALNGMAESLKHMTISIKTLEQEKAGRMITERKFEKASAGVLSLMLELHAGLFDITKAIEAARQEADRAHDEKLKRALELLRPRADGMIKSMEKDIYASKLETGALEFKMEIKDLRDIIKGSIFIFEPKVRAKGLGLKLDFPKSAMAIRADKDKIKEVLDILIENSLMATEKGSISVSVRELKDGVELSVSDTGEGIRKESIGEVFERFSGFSRVKPQESFDKSSGFGPEQSQMAEGSMPGPDMYIARLIIEKHDGRIKAESEPGGWTRFSFTLPRV